MTRLAATLAALAALAYAAHRWATTHPDTDRVERGARALAASSGVQWDGLNDFTHDVLRGHARAVLAAGR